jgi:HlyD family secretion protein
MTATVEFVTGSATNVLTVPNAALRFKPTADELAASGLPATAGTDTTRRQRGSGATTATGGSATFGGGAQTAPSGQAGGGPAGAGGATGGAAGAAGGAARTRRSGSSTGGAGSIGTVWLFKADKKLQPVRVRVGLADTQRTQVSPLSGQSLQAGADVVVGTTLPGAAATAASTNPLTPTRQGGGPGGRGP